MGTEYSSMSEHFKDNINYTQLMHTINHTKGYTAPRDYHFTDEQIAEAFNSAKAKSTKPIDTQPNTFAEALKAPDAPDWVDAMTTEMNRFYTNDTWELVYLPHGHKAITSKWVFKIKKKSD